MSLLTNSLQYVGAYNQKRSPKILGGWLPTDNNEFTIRCAKCLINFKVEDIDAIYEGDVEDYGVMCDKCQDPIFTYVESDWIACPSNFDGGLDCTPFCPTCQGVQFIKVANHV